MGALEPRALTGIFNSIGKNQLRIPCVQMPDAQNTTENVTYIAKFACPFSLKATYYTFIAQLSTQSQSRLPSFILTKELTNSMENVTPFPLWIKQNYPTKSYFENQKNGVQPVLENGAYPLPYAKAKNWLLSSGCREGKFLTYHKLTH